MIMMMMMTLGGDTLSLQKAQLCCWYVVLSQDCACMRIHTHIRYISNRNSVPFYQCVFCAVFAACKQKEQEQQQPKERTPKKPRLVFTDIQRRTLHAIFKETKRPSKEMQATIAKQLGLEVSTVANFFMNARRRYHKFQGVVCEDTMSNGDSSQSACSQS